MMVPGFLLAPLARWTDHIQAGRAPDLVIGGEANPYLRRWWVIPRNRFFNLYLHEILRSDDDRALHDHPWWNVTLVVRGCYVEHTIEAGGIHRKAFRGGGALKLRRAVDAHRLEVIPGTFATTLFFTGPRLRPWGFHCERGWRHWRDFTSGPNGETVGRGCGELDEVRP